MRRLSEGDHTAENPNSPRNVMNAFYFKPPFRAPKEREEVLLTSMLSTKVAEENYPGERAPSGNWPNVAPGKTGINNAISPKYCDVGGFARIDPKSPVLWIRGADDALISDASLLDLGNLGGLGVVPGWPGEGAYPPQPMSSLRPAPCSRRTPETGAPTVKKRSKTADTRRTSKSPSRSSASSLSS